MMKTLERQHPDADTELHSRRRMSCSGDHPLGAVHRRALNQVTPALFKRYPDAKALGAATTADLEPQIQSTGFFRAKSKSLSGMAAALDEKHDGPCRPPWTT